MKGHLLFTSVFSLGLITLVESTIQEQKNRLDKYDLIQHSQFVFLWILTKDQL